MNNDEAKFILRAFRANGADANEAVFLPALEQAQRDPGLAAWLERERAYDLAVTAALRGIEPPLRLKEAILAGAKASRTSVRPVRRRRRFFFPLAVAASLVLAFTAVGVWQHHAEATSRRMMEFIINDAQHPEAHGGHSELAVELAQGLGSGKIQLPAALAEDFARLKDSGCRTVAFAGHPMVEICFVRGGDVYHLYVMQSSTLPRPIWSRGEGYFDANGGAATMWTRGKLTYVVAAANATQPLLRELAADTV